MRRPVALALCVLLGIPRLVTAEPAQPIFREIPICTRLPPPKPKPGEKARNPLSKWAFGHSGDLITEDDMLFTVLTAGKPIYVYRPDAPPANIKRLPIAYNHLTCPPYVPPPPKEPAPKPAPPREQKKDTKAPDEAPPPEPERDEYGNIIPPGVKDKRLPERPPERPRRAPPPPQGVLSNAPLLPSEGVLAQESVLPRRDEVSPPKYVDEEQTLVDRGGTLPELQHRPGRPLVSVVPCAQTKEGCKGEGEGQPKTRFETFAQNLMLAGGLLNGDLGEDIHRADGKEFGMLGGDNPDGVNNPVVQAAAGVLLATTAILGVPGKAFAERLERAIQKKEGPIVIQSAEELSRETAEKLAAHYKEYIADALEKNGTLGPYELMREFTQGLEGQWQAHHILEQAMARDWQLAKNLDKIPSVILTKAKHKEITDMLKTLTPRARDVKGLWKAYQRAYVDYPHWLEAIKPYFGK